MRADSLSWEFVLRSHPRQVTSVVVGRTVMFCCSGEAGEKLRGAASQRCCMAFRCNTIKSVAVGASGKRMIWTNTTPAHRMNKGKHRQAHTMLVWESAEQIPEPAVSLNGPIKQFKAATKVF